MKIIILFVIALSIATGMAYLIHLDPGYVIFTYGVWSLETSLAVFIFVILVSFAGLYMLLRTVLNVKHAPKKLLSWSKQRKQSTAHLELTKGLLDSAEGNWARSEKLLTKHAAQSDTPLLNYLSAAHAAQALGAYDRRDAYLLKAGDVVPERAKTIHLARAKLQFAAAQYEQSLATVRQLVDASPKHPIALTLLMKVYAKLNDWEALYALLPSVKKNDKVYTTDIQQLETHTITQLLSNPPSSPNVNIDSIWMTLDKRQKANPQYLALYAAQKIRLNTSQAVAEPLLKAIKEQSDPKLISLYSQLDIEPAQKIKNLEKWLKPQPNNIELLNALGELYLKQKLWGKAQQTIQHSLDIKTTSKAYLLIGRLHEEQGETPDKAAEFYRLGLELSDKTNALAVIRP
jgi:HemY protein